MKKRGVKEKKQNKDFVWYSVRIGFCVMIGMWVLFSIFANFLSDLNQSLIVSLLSLLWIGITIFTFVTSIIHLRKYKAKTFAIVALVISSIIILLFLIGFVIGFIGGFSKVLNR